MQWFGSAVSLLKQTFKEWNEDNVPRLGAALAFYAILSIAPIGHPTAQIVFFGAEFTQVYAKTRGSYAPR